MALIDTTINQTPAQKAATRIRQQSASIHAALLGAHQIIFHALWHTPDATPQEILTELGGDAAGLFYTGSRAVEIVLSQKPDALTEDQYMPPQAPIINPDGSVTLMPAPDPEP